MLSPEDVLGEGPSSSSHVCSSDTLPVEPSAEQECPICLGICENAAYVDPCMHRFCFSCIKEWAKNKPDCPFCKQPSYAILHSVKADNNYQVLDLKVSENDYSGSPVGSWVQYHSANTSPTVSPFDHRLLFSDAEEDYSNSAVIIISPDEAEESDRDVDSFNVGAFQARWDDETAGPSYTTLDSRPTTTQFLTITSESSSDESSSSGAAKQTEVTFASDPKCGDYPVSDDDCLIVGFIKPPAERITSDRIGIKDKGKKPMKNRDVNFSKRSQNVAIPSARSRSREQPQKSYTSSCHAQDTNYQRDANAYEQSHGSGRGQNPTDHLTRSEHAMQSSSERKNAWGPSSGMDSSRCHKPSGKRKCKIRHYEDSEEEESQQPMKRIKIESRKEKSVHKSKATEKHKGHGKKKKKHKNKPSDTDSDKETKE